MNALKLAAGMGSGGNQTLYQIISGLGLTTNLKLCLDAGDAASYDPAVQTAKWLDTSGNGYDFYRGDSTGGDAAEPTFSGSAGGLSSNEYWSFDGGDWFSYDTTAETWMNNLHKDGAISTFFAVLYTPSLTANLRIFNTRSGVASGVNFGQTTAGRAQMSSFNVSTASSITSTASLNLNAWNILSTSWNENGGANNKRVKLNFGAVELQTGGYTTPDTANASAPGIGADAAGGTKFANGTRLACLAVWEGTALTSTNLDDLHQAIRGRFGL